jgi:hypothetical protein
MCQTESFKSCICSHKWMTIVSICEPGAGFNRYERHQFTKTRKGPLQSRFVSAGAHTCPSCDKKGNYDGNLTRIVLEKGQASGNLGNGYDMTDGRGNVIPVGGHGDAQYPSGYGNGSPGYTINGVAAPNQTRPSSAQVVCCLVM